MSFLQDSCAIAETGQKNLSQHLLNRFYKGDTFVGGCLEPLNTNWVLDKTESTSFIPAYGCGLNNF